MIEFVTKMINFNDDTKENAKEHNPNLPQIPDHTCRILIISIVNYQSRNYRLK